MLTEPTLLDVEYICVNARQSDKDEILNMVDYDSPIQMAWDAHFICKNKGRARVAWHNGKPAGFFGFSEMWRGTWQVWMFGTDDFKAVVWELLRWARKEANHILTVCEGRRLQCYCREGHPDAHRLLRALGARPEGEWMRGYGKDGSSYQCYVWLNGDNDAILKPHYVAPSAAE